MPPAPQKKRVSSPIAEVTDQQDQNNLRVIRRTWAGASLRKNRDADKLPEDLERTRDQLKQPLQPSRRADRRFFEPFSLEDEVSEVTIERTQQALAKVQVSVSNAERIRDNKLRKRNRSLSDQIESLQQQNATSDQ